MTSPPRSLDDLRPRFEEIYESCIVGGGFTESDEYYRRDRERYWHSLAHFCSLDIKHPARILEIGGGQLAVLIKRLFRDHCTVGDISETFASPVIKENIDFTICNLVEGQFEEIQQKYDVVILLEVIEHLPLPAYVIFDRIKEHLLSPNGILFLTTPNLFRLRNLARMFLGIEFLDRFELPRPGQGLGHQLEYSADHLKWQLNRAKMDIIMLKHDELGRIGHSQSARIARTLLSPLRLRPIWRDGLVAAARNRA